MAARTAAVAAPARGLTGTISGVVKDPENSSARVQGAITVLMRAVCLALAAFLMAGLAVAQVTKGSLSGTVVDPSGALVPGADVKIVEVSTGAVQKATSDASGNFRFNLITTGTYDVEVVKQGFAAALLRGMAVNPGVETALGSIPLTVGRATEVVEVSGSVELVETTQTQVASNFTQQTFLNLPNMTSNAGMDQLAMLVPGVVGTRDNNFSNTNGAAFAVDGLRGRNNDQQIDGQNNNDNSVAGPAMFLSNAEFVGEYQIVTNNFLPEYGRNAGSVVNIITKSGTNTLHGSVYGTENNSVLNTLSNTQKAFEGLTKVPWTNDEFTGFTVGGPIRKDRLFFFGGFDQEYVGSGSVFSSGSLTPTPAGLQSLTGCYPNSTSLAALKQYGPYGITAGNPVPSGTLQYKTVGTCQNVQMAGVQRTLASPYKEYDWMTKVDYQGTKNSFSARYMYQKTNSANASGTGSTGYIVDVPGGAHSARANWTHNFGARMVNELSVNWGRMTAEFGGNAMGTVPTIGNIGNALASIGTGSGNLGFGPSNTYPQGRIVNTWQVQDNWNFVAGRHTLKAGVNWTYQRSPNTFLPNLNGSFSFTNWTNFITNTPSTVSISLGNPNLDFREYDTFWYFGDAFKVTPTLTLNYGVTYTYYGQPANLYHQNDLKQQTGPQPFWNPSLPQSVTVYPEMSAPKNQLGPSAGFAWAPKFLGEGKTVLRGGFRRSYDPPFYNIYLNMASSAPQVLALTLTGANLGSIQLPAAPTGPNVRSMLAPYLKTGVADPRSYNQTRLTSDFGPDHVNSWSFGIQRQFAKDVVFETRYVGNQGRNLFQSLDGNPLVSNLASAFPSMVPSGVAPCSSANAVVPGAVGRRDCNYGIERIRSNNGYSDYNGWQNELRINNMFNQLTIRGAYTFSKTTDNVSEIFSTGGGGNTTAYAQNPFDTSKGEHALSGLDFPHRFTLMFYEALPFFRHRNGLLGKVAGGWGISATYTLASGQTYTPVQYCFAYSACGGGVAPDPSFTSAYAGFYDNLRPFWGSPSAPATAVGIYAGDACNYFGIACSGISPTQLISLNAANANGTVQPVSNKGAVRYIINAQYSQQDFGTPFGNVPRSAGRDFWTNSANATIFKNTKIRERLTAEFNVTLTNVFNHPNFGSVDVYLDDAGFQGEGNGFGDPTLTSGGTRTIRFHLGVRW
jgi:hypothetical protein